MYKQLYKIYFIKSVQARALGIYSASYVLNRMYIFLMTRKRDNVKIECGLTGFHISIRLCGANL